MALIDLQSVSKQYEAQKILEEVNFTVDEGERVCIVGKNGSGKSTLMKIARGVLETDDGKRIVRNGVTVEMLDQVPRFDPVVPVRRAIEDQLVELKEAKEKFETLSHQLTEAPEDKNLLGEITTLSTFLDFHNAWNMDDRIERVLTEFDLKRYETTPVGSLSGGEQRRVALAGLLLKKPDVLLLDEPTNHLDVYMVRFLEEMLLRENFTLLFISHDRYFIDRLATRTVEVEEAKLRSFKGGYADYLRQKEQLLQAMVKEHETLQKILKSEEEWLSRGVKARLKRNEGRKQRVMEMREAAKKNPGAIRKVRLQLEREKKAFNREESVNRKKMFFEAERLRVKAGDKLLIDNFDTRILQKDRIAIVGRNGSGKSTLLKVLLGELKPEKGHLDRGDFTLGYFDQHRAMLDDSKDLIETFCPNGGDRVDVQGRNMHVYGYLRNWLFPREFLDKKVGILSGGEKNRVALALLFTKKVDCLILDEPTNDLDIPTINILEEALLNFPGALIFVSHDRYFVDKIARKLFIFKGNGVVEESHQTYTEYLEMEEELLELEAMEREAENAPAEEEPKREAKKQVKLSYKEQREYDALSGKIEALEAELEKLEGCLYDPECAKEHGGVAALHDETEAKKAELETMVERYLELEEKRETLREG